MRREQRGEEETKTVTVVSHRVSSWGFRRATGPNDIIHMAVALAGGLHRWSSAESPGRRHISEDSENMQRSRLQALRPASPRQMSLTAEWTRAHPPVRARRPLPANCWKTLTLGDQQLDKHGSSSVFFK